VAEILSWEDGLIEQACQQHPDWCSAGISESSRAITIVRRAVAHFARLAGNRSHHGARRDRAQPDGKVWVQTDAGAMVEELPAVRFGSRAL
jgi:hypothetical protein